MEVQINVSQLFDAVFLALYGISDPGYHACGITSMNPQTN